MRPLFNKFYSPDDASGPAAPPEPVRDTFDILNEEDVETPETLDINKAPTPIPEGDETEGEEGEKEEEIDELAEIEEELRGPKEEDLELTTPVRRKEILGKYPQLFKDFPYLEKAYYREQQFTELLPTIQDARVAVDKARILDNVENQIRNGDISTVLHAAKQDNPESFNRIADNYLQTLRNVDQQAYYNVMGNVIKDTIITLVREGRALGEQGAPLQAAANVLNQFIFGSQNFTPPQPLSRPKDPQEAQREYEARTQQQQQFMGQFTSVRDDLQTKADNVLKATIDQNIDPNGSMTDYVRRNANREAFETLEDLMSRDTRFRGLLDRLWERAFATRFDKKATDQIKAAYLSKAKTLLPSVVKKARNDALRGLGRSVRGSNGRNTQEEEQVETPARRGPSQPGRSTPPSSGKIRKPSDIPKGMSTLDVLMMKD